METFSALLTLCAGNSPVPDESPHKGQWRGVLIFPLICAQLNGWVNNDEAGDLRRHWADYDVIVMIYHNDKFLYLAPPSIRLKAGFGEALEYNIFITNDNDNDNDNDNEWQWQWQWTCFRSHCHTIATHTVMWQSHSKHLYITMSAFLLLYFL